MIDIKYLRENAEKVRSSTIAKGIDGKIVDEILDLDSQYKQTIQQWEEFHSTVLEEQGKTEKLLTEKGIDSDEVKQQLKITKKLREEEKEIWTKVKDLFNNRRAILTMVPNPAKDDVKVGKDESDNELIRKQGSVPTHMFKTRDHLELGELLDIIDVQRASKVSGSRFAYLKNEGVLLEFALVQFAFETLIKEGFTPIVPPVLIKTEVMKGLGYMENGGDEDMFHIPADGFTLVGTAEHSIVPMHMDETFAAKDLPRRYVGFSTAFRREAGSYGKDTRGILRVHQFDKVEMVSYVKEGEDDREQDYLLSLEEKLFQALEIPYQVVKMCTGDLGFPAARKFDLEAWMPGQNKYREVTSVSTIVDFQSRRLNIKYQNGDEKKFVSILNGTGYAIGRTIIAILENFQQEDGSVRIPEVLQKYMGGVGKIELKK